MSILSKRQTMGIAAGIMAGSILLSRLMGLVRDKVISFYYGANLESDIYFASFVIPDFINYLLAGGYFSITLIPLLSGYFEKDKDDGWRFFGAVFCWLGLSITLLTAAAMLFAPQLAELAAPGFDAPATARLARFLRIILPAQIFFLTGSCLTALLYLRKQFLVPALTPLVYNGAIIGMGLLFIGSGMEGFCWGVLAGSVLGNFLLPLVAAMGGGGVRIPLRLRHPGLKTFILLALPLMIGQSVVVLDEQFLRIFGSMAQEGAVSWLNYARRITFVPVGVVAQAAGVASYPFLAQLAATGQTGRFNSTMNTALRNTILFIAPLSLWMIIVAGPTVRIIFEQGRFSAGDTASTALCLQIMLAVVICWGVQQIAGRAFYAHKDTLTPALTGTAATLLSLPLYWLLGKHYGALGVALASASSVALYTLALTLVWVRRHGREGFTGLGRVTAKVLGLCLAAGLAAWPGLKARALFSNPDSIAAAFGGLAASGLLFGLVYVGLGLWLAPDLVRPVLDKVLSRLVRRRGRGNQEKTPAP